MKSNSHLQMVFQPDYIIDAKHPKSFKSDAAFHEYLKSFPLYKCFPKEIQVKNGYFDCLFFEKQIAWFYQDEQKHFRYYTKTKNGFPISLDMIDFLEIYYDITALEAKSLFLKWTNASIQDTFYENHLRTRYEENDVLFDYLIEENPKYEKLLNSLSFVYKELLKIGRTPDYLTSLAYEIELFFASTRYLSARIGYLDHTNISRILNMLDAIGLIEKVEIDCLSANTRNKIMKWSKSMGYKKTVGFFRIPSILEKEKEIKAKLDYCFKEKLSYRDANTLFKIDIELYMHGKSKPKNKEFLNEFKRILEQKAYVRKSDFISKDNHWKKSEIEEMWDFCVKELNLIYQRPNKEMLFHYELSSFEYIAIPKI